MLTIQPNLVNSYGKVPAFGEYPADYGNYIDFEEFGTYTETPDDKDAKETLTLLKQAQHNIDAIVKTTESIPAVNKGFRIFSGLISVVIGWGGLRWGTKGTLNVLSDIGKTTFAKSIKSATGSTYTYTKGLMSSGKDFVKNSSWYRSIANAMNGSKESFLNTAVGQKLVSWDAAVKNNPVYNAVVGAKNNTVAYMRKLNPKRIFVETMGVAGGGTALVNELGGKPVNGVHHDIQETTTGYTIDGRKGDFCDVA